MDYVFIGGAWPYANGDLHLGRLSSLLPGDVLARYYRAKGKQVLFVSGSDCHGTPIAVQAAKEGVTPKIIADRYHERFVDCFAQLGISYDWYTRTDQTMHHHVVQEIFTALLHKGVLYRKTVQQAYCETDERFLPDRYVEGTCPVCGSAARGDQCDVCGTLLDPSDLLDRTCKLCGNPPVERQTEHYYFELSKFLLELSSYAEHATGWRDNAVQMTQRYLTEGLQDRAVTRDLDWGVDVPVSGFEAKKIYVWIEAVCGYLSASKQWADETGNRWEPYWLEGEAEVLSYYVHGKDNIPFHTVIWPAILQGVGGLHLPDRIVSSEYMTLEGKKFSTSRNWAVWVPDMLERYPADAIRYFLIANGPERRDTDFSWREFIHSHNGELLGAFGNFVNRTLVFLQKSYDSLVPDGSLDPEWKDSIDTLYQQSGTLIEEGRLKESLELIFAYIRRANKYFDERKPWLQVKVDRSACGDTLYTCTQIIANLANLLQPFIPFACDQIRTFLSLAASPVWHWIEVPVNQSVQHLALLFERIDVQRIEEEARILNQQST
ncbi:methionine--tRNA ligase [Paenibacillus guangzhouensis]|uniref:methionine--tRNA ligase n=1 Tax=Paenibacillus guangzhouensis TaxID=1473112 RepID=UPI001267025A|nr:methionine--tRNA ligase [Paenibacillus guangzhouensis]